jgi:hypothetical protein
MARQVAYNAVMRLLGTLLTVTLLHIAIVALVFAIVFMQLFAEPTSVKETMAESGAYQVLVDDVSQQLGEQATDAFGGDGATAYELAQQTLDANLVQEQFETAIDAVYEWLKGEVDEPRFTIDFSSARSDFIDGIASELEEELATLPTCTSFDQAQPGANPQDLTCIPPGVTTEELVESYEQELLASDDFLPEAELSSEELFADTDYDFTDSNAPKVFQLLSNLLWPSIAAVVLFSLLLVGLAKTKNRGWRRVGGQYIIAGVGLVLSAGIVWLALDSLLVIEQGTQLQTALFEAFRVLLNDMLLVIAVSGGVVIATGLLLRKLIKKPAKS